MHAVKTENLTFVTLFLLVLFFTLFNLTFLPMPVFCEWITIIGNGYPDCRSEEQVYLQFLKELCKGKTPRTFFSPTHFYHIIPVKCLIGKQGRLKGQCHEMFHLYLRDSNRSGQIFHMLRYFRVQFRICGDICMCKNFTVFGTQRTKQFCNLSKEFFFYYMRQFCSWSKLI